MNYKNNCIIVMKNSYILIPWHEYVVGSGILRTIESGLLGNC